MHYRILLVVGLLSLTACTSTPIVVDSTHQPEENDASLEAVEPVDVVIPPPLTNGAFTPLTLTPLNESTAGLPKSDNALIFSLCSHEGVIYLFWFNGNEIFYAVSPDGADWVFDPDPIMTGLYNDDFELRPISLAHTPAGWAIYFSSATIDYAEHDYLYSIWRATSVGLDGPWTMGDAPILYGYGASSWDAFYISHPIVRPFENGYRMYYRGAYTIEGIANPMFGVGHSLDGEIWRHTLSLPETDMPDDDTLLLVPDDSTWGRFSVLDVWQTTDGWQMLYISKTEGEDYGNLQLAESYDGLQWTPSSLEITLPEAVQPERLLRASLIYHKGAYYLAHCSLTLELDHTICFVSHNR